jgi:hypothetical protein
MNGPLPKVVVQHRRARLVLGAFVGAALTVLFAWMLVAPEQVTGRSSWFARFLGLGGFFLLAFITLRTVRWLGDNKPALVLDDWGILDNINSKEGYGIPWSDIKSARVGERVYYRGLIPIRSRHVELALQQPPKPIRSKQDVPPPSLGWDTGMMGNTLEIGGILSVTPDELVYTINKFLRQRDSLPKDRPAK